MRLTLHTFLTLDGVLQAPGGRDEDPSDGFTYGGWTVPFDDEDFGAAMTGYFEHAEAFLLGRRTYEIFAGFWPHVAGTDQDGVIAQKLNALPKHVASTTLTSVDWNNSHLIDGDVAETVRKLKEQPGGELQVHGSGALATYLVDQRLVDEYRLLTFPVYLGAGRKLFADGVRPGALKLLSSSTSSTGIVISAYEAAGDPEFGTYELGES